MGSYTPAPNSALSPGDRLDRYELLCMLAQGGMGSVWLARLSGKHGFERLVALKTILPTYGNDRTFVDMFLDEARIAARIDHENVVRTLEIGEDREILYHAMELIDGESVRKLYRDVRTAGAAFPLGVALRVVADTCAGLHAVHELRGPDGNLLDVVHRDVSPQNVLLTTRGTVKLIDFGVAKANERITEATTAGTLKGKIEYMAPEQADGRAVDRRADIYALGAMLYELLAGEPVRNTEDGRQLLALHELMTGVPYEPLHPGVPLPIRTIVDRALANDPNDRFMTAEDMRKSIEAAMLQIGLIATTDDVAAALAHFSKDRTTRRKDAIDAALKVAQALEKEKSNPGAAIPSGSSPVLGPTTSPSRASVARPSQKSLRSLSVTGDSAVVKGTLVQPLAPPIPLSGGGGSQPHPLEGQIVMGPNGPQLFAAPISSGQLPSDGAPTGPSMRTMQGASISAAPPAPSGSGRSIGTVAVLGFVGVLGVVAGVLVARQPRAEGPPPVITYVPATQPPPSATQAILPPAPIPLAPAPAPAPIASDKPAVSQEKPKKPPPPKPKKPKSGGGGDEYGF